MALFTDGGIGTLEDLTGYDSGLLGVVGPEGIDTTKKLSLAQQEVGVELEAVLPRAGVALVNVVVTTPLRMWVVFKTLELVYRDAYHNQLNDRYKGKWQEYRELAQWAQQKLLETGVGIATEPLPRPVLPELEAVAGALEEGTYYVCMAWANAAGEESAASEWNTAAVGAGAGLTITPGTAPAGACGWNVYAGTSAESMRLQNDNPLPPGAAWTWVGPARVEGREPGDGQTASYTRALPRILQRG
ncbi:MAG: hypothetical protein M1541_22420 [Acidobacteria bacterium]|nr:hypothetical protein [Acidobacteriota bacterium]